MTTSLKWLLVVLVVVILGGGGWYYYSNYIKKTPTLTSEIENSASVKFRLIDSETKEPIRNWDIYICNFAFDARCDETAVNSDLFIKKTKSNKEGYFSLNIAKSSGISSINLGKPYFYEGFNYDEDTKEIRVVYLDDTGRVKFNRLYNWETKKVKEYPLDENLPSGRPWTEGSFIEKDFDYIELEFSKLHPDLGPGI